MIADAADISEITGTYATKTAEIDIAHMAKTAKDRIEKALRARTFRSS
jgi:hypothetical protein